MDLKHIIRKKVIEVLNEEIKRNESLITEMWSYSEDMDSAMEYVYDTIANNINNTERHIMDKGIVLIKGVIKNNLTLFNIPDITCEYYVYDSSDDEKYRFIYKNGYSVNGYYEKEKLLVVTLYTVNGRLIEEPSNKNLSHELEHILQISKGLEHNKNYSQLMNSAYNYASEIIADSTSSITETILAWLIYYSNKHEQDAFMNEYYQDLRNNQQFVNDKDSETHIRLADYADKYEKFNKYADTSEMRDAIKHYKMLGYTKANLSVMFNKGLNRFKKKMLNIEKHFNNVVKQANESHIRLRKINNGSLIRLL